MVRPQVPKYQAIHTVLRSRILGGEYPAGSRLPAQHDLAEEFSVTIMTLRQAIAALVDEGLVRAERGRGTFVAERPVDISLGNLSSFAAQMRGAGVDLVTEVLSVDRIAAADDPAASEALGVTGELTRIVRRRGVEGVPVSLQRSVLSADLLDIRRPADLTTSLYDAIEAATGRAITSARETITAVALVDEDAALLDSRPGAPALLSVRTSLDQFGRAFLHDEAVLVGERTVIQADRSSDRLSLGFGHVSA